MKITVNQSKITLTAVAILLGVIAAQQSSAQTGFFNNQPLDFDRLFSAQVYNNDFPGSVSAARACKTNRGDPCLGYLSVRFANAEYTVSGGVGTFTADIEARAGQEAIGALYDLAADTEGVIDLANPANILYDAAMFLTYSKQIFASSTAWDDACDVDHKFYEGSIQEGNDAVDPPIPAIPSDDIADDVSGTASAYGVQAYVYTTDFDGDEPEEIDDEEERADIELLQWQHDEYRLMYTMTCTLPAGHEGQTLGLAFHPLVVPSGINSQHLGDKENRFYLTKAENNLWYFPLVEGQNYIADAEITEGGDAILIEYANDVDAAIREGAGEISYTVDNYVGGQSRSLSHADATWLDNRTVWLDLRGSVYGSSLDVDNEDFVNVISSFDAVPSTYRVALTRNFNPPDRQGRAPTISSFALGSGSAYVDITFEGGLDDGSGGEGTGVWGINQPSSQSVTAGGALTADHFDVVMYLSGGEPTQITIASVIGNVEPEGYTSARLTFDFEGYEVTGDERIIVRTAERARFSDQFITDRTIFGHATTVRYVPSPLDNEEYIEALSGIIHLQSGALMQLAPKTTYSLELAENHEAEILSRTEQEITIVERDSGDVSTVNFVISRGASDGAGRVEFEISSEDGVQWSEIRVGNDATTPGQSVGFQSVTVSFPDGQNTMQVAVVIPGDDASQGHRTFAATLSLVLGDEAFAELAAPPGIEATVRIRDDELSLEVLLADDVIEEGEGSRLQIGGTGEGRPVTITVTELGEGNELLEVAQVLVLLDDGSYTTTMIELFARDEKDEVQGDRTVEVEISAYDGEREAIARVTLQVMEDDTTVRAMFAEVQTTVTEGGSVESSLKLSALAPAGGVTVVLTVIGEGEGQIGLYDEEGEESATQIAVFIGEGERTANFRIMATGEVEDEASYEIEITSVSEREENNDAVVAIGEQSVLTVTVNELILEVLLADKVIVIEEGESSRLQISGTGGGRPVTITVTELGGSNELLEVAQVLVPLDDGSYTTTMIELFAREEEDKVQGDRTVEVEISAYDGEREATARLTVQILENDTTVKAMFGEVQTTVTEGGSVESSLKLSALAPAGGVTVVLTVIGEGEGQIGLYDEEGEESATQIAVFIGEGERTANFRIMATGEVEDEASYEIEITDVSDIENNDAVVDIGEQSVLTVTVTDPGVLIFRIKVFLEGAR